MPHPSHPAKAAPRAFAELLFLRLRPEALRALPRAGQTALYALAGLTFYGPILLFALRLCIAEPELIVYALAVCAFHVLSKVMLVNSKRIQKRFSTMKHRKNIFLRLWLIIEYIVFMWLVYLFYPLTCILAPLSLLGMAAENLLGHDALMSLFLAHSEQFISWGAIASYVLFILADGYKKLRSGFLPDYLGLYALLSMLSASAEGAMNRLFAFWRVDISDVTGVLSEVFTLSNNSMKLVASAMTAFFALYSLYNNCGTVETNGDNAEIDEDFALDFAPGEDDAEAE